MKLTPQEIEDKMQAEIEKGWLPSHLRGLSCSCHISAPCSKCCLDGDYVDEFCEEFDINQEENTTEVDTEEADFSGASDPAGGIDPEGR